MGFPEPTPRPDVWELLASLAVQLPLYIVLLAGMLFALINLSRQPRACVLTLLAVTVFLPTQVLMTLLEWYWSFHHEVHSVQWDPGGKAKEAQLAYWVADGIRCLLFGISFSLLWWAVFAWRQPPEPAVPDNKREQAATE